MLRQSGGVIGLTFLLLVALPGPASSGMERGRGYQEELRPTDELLEQRVKAALAVDPTVESFEIVVTVFRGSVRLNGAVDTDEERARAGSIAADIEGVLEVENQITVERPLVSTDRSDAEMRRQIVDEVADAFPDENIDISVEDGLATIRGAVSSAEARGRITEIAFRAGALLVKNQLAVESE
ncbi:MAG TPA: BON domain-containing protein [Vicinamibacteria bacterium]|nr:BON domain-containing protein [Vicinamibacteria bacterium]